MTEFDVARNGRALRNLADWRDVNFPVARVPEVRDFLRARAAALTATPNHGRNAT